MTEYKLKTRSNGSLVCGEKQPVLTTFAKLCNHCFTEKVKIWRICALFIIFVTTVITALSCSNTQTMADRLRAIHRGIWVSTSGAYTVWTDTHYFVLSASGDKTSTNIYLGASQVLYTDKGIARKQNLRLRQIGERDRNLTADYSIFRESSAGGIELAPLEIDEKLFNPEKCVVKGGVIYDAIAEVTDEYILISSCNGDKIRIYEDNRLVYLPASGGEHWSYRIESF